MTEISESAGPIPYHQLVLDIAENAQKYGVETHRQLSVPMATPPKVLRSDIEIAHDVLAKLPLGQFKLIWHGYGDEWCADDGDPDNWLCCGTFVDAVTALAKRSNQ